MEYTKEQLRALYLKLPENVKEILNSEETLDKTQEIGKKYNLHIDKIGALGKNIGQLILGAIKPNQFVNQLSQDLSLPVEQVQPIAKEINEQIFRPIREELKKIHQLNEGGGETILAAKPTNFDDRLGKYLSTNNNPKDNSPTPKPYTHDPYLEPTN